MREILFRGKTYDGKWEQGDLRHGGYVHNDSQTYIMRSDYALHNIPVDPKTVGQYTGLTDKNGTKIFEGDIIETKNGVYACFWDSCNFEFGVDNKKESFGIAYVPIKGLKVIGNIHDNPELLESEVEGE